jgi:hypothetical protein
LNVIDPKQKKLASRAHCTASNLAPVRHALIIQVKVESRHALIRFANSGTNNFFNSSSVRVHANAATIAPAEVPDMTLGSNPSSNKARIWPK